MPFQRVRPWRERPPLRDAWYGIGEGGMCTPMPPSPAGSLPASNPSRKEFQRRCQAADHPVRRPSSRCVGATAKDPGGELGTGPTVGGTAPATGNGGP